jgi:hypothetical protein
MSLQPSSMCIISHQSRAIFQTSTEILCISSPRNSALEFLMFFEEEEVRQGHFHHLKQVNKGELEKRMIFVSFFLASYGEFI